MGDVERMTFEAIKIVARGGRGYMVSLTRDPQGDPETLTITPGWVEPWRPDPRPLSISGELIGEFRAALAQLAGEP